MQVPKFLKREGDSLLYNQEGELVFYVPEEYFSRNFAIIMGEYVNLIGLLDYAIFNTNGKHNGLKQFRLPTVFLSKPGEIEKIRNVKLTAHSEPQDYRLLKFKKGDTVIVSVRVPQIVDNAEEFFKIFLSGSLPTTIPYDKLHEYFPENIRLNGADYGLNMQQFGIIVSEMARDPKDHTKLFRHTSMNNMNEYTSISIKDIPKYVSAFTSITSENWDEAVINAITNKNPGYSPLEKLFTD